MEKIPISIVIPTCNRKARLLSILRDLDNSNYPVDEVIVVDSGEDRVLQSEYSSFKNISVQHLQSERSVCIQRNIGIKAARSAWIFLCDDDIEMPPDYLQILTKHIGSHPDAGAVSGQILQKENEEWKSTYPVYSAKALFFKYIFQLSIWGEIHCRSNYGIIKKIKRYYQQKGNHISKAGWPANTMFSGEYVICPVFGLGASLVKKEWLAQSAYDEVLDSHGIGDNYGVAINFPTIGIHVVNKAFVYHHQEPLNRLQNSLQYYRRVLALDYFRKTKPRLRHIKKSWLIWSLIGNLISHLFAGKFNLVKVGVKSILKISFNSNPYFKGNKEKKKVIEPK